MRDLTPRTLTAQVRAELKMRLRSFATPIALLVFLVGAFLWIPDPTGRSATLTWELADGRIQSPIYTAAYVGLASAILSCISLTLGGSTSLPARCGGTGIRRSGRSWRRRRSRRRRTSAASSRPTSRTSSSSACSLWSRGSSRF